MPDGSCQDLINSACNALGGQQGGRGSTCATSPACPQPEACCFPDGSCQDLFAPQCVTQGGASEGPGSKCATFVCPQPPQACCEPGNICQDLDPNACTAASGVPQGRGTSCVTTNCSTMAHPGFVPNGATRPGTPLTVRKSATAPQLDLAWGASCSATTSDYAIYEGTIVITRRPWYDHSSLTCTTGNTLTQTITPTAGTFPSNHYYLIVPLTAASEGSYGLDSNGVERPVAAAPCRAVQDLLCR